MEDADKDGLSFLIITFNGFFVFGDLLIWPIELALLLSNYNPTICVKPNYVAKLAPCLLMQTLLPFLFFVQLSQLTSSRPKARSEPS